MVVVVLLQSGVAFMLVEFKLAVCRVALAYAEACEPDFAVLAQNKVLGVDSAVYDALFMQIFKRG